MADPYLQIREAARSTQTLKKFFRPFGPQFSLKIREGRPPGPTSVRYHMVHLKMRQIPRVKSDEILILIHLLKRYYGGY